MRQCEYELRVDCLPACMPRAGKSRKNSGNSPDKNLAHKPYTFPDVDSGARNSHTRRCHGGLIGTGTLQTPYPSVLRHAPKCFPVSTHRLGKRSMDCSSFPPCSPGSSPRPTAHPAPGYSPRRLAAPTSARHSLSEKSDGEMDCRIGFPLSSTSVMRFAASHSASANCGLFAMYSTSFSERIASVIYIAACFDPRIFPMVIVEYLIR